jgi:nitrous oxidase accessory protein NosD
MEDTGEDVPRDPFGHVKLDSINPGQWFALQFALAVGAEKVLVQKSGYFSRSAPANEADSALIRDCTSFAVGAALRSKSGVIGHDEERGDELRVIEFEWIDGGKKFHAPTLVCRTDASLRSGLNVTCQEAQVIAKRLRNIRIRGVYVDQSRVVVALGQRIKGLAVRRSVQRGDQEQLSA